MSFGVSNLETSWYRDMQKSAVTASQEEKPSRLR